MVMAAQHCECLMLPNCTLKMLKMVNFVMYFATIN